MRWWQRVTLVLLVIILLASNLGTAYASSNGAGDPLQINIQNKTGSELRINLVGPITVWWTISTGRTKAELPAGTYQYSYRDCEQTITGTFIVKKKGNTLKLLKCKNKNASGKNSGDIQINYQNKSGAPIRIHLTGPKTIWLTLPTGRTKAELPAGTYQYSYQACGQPVTGTFIVKKKGNTLKLVKCKSKSGSAQNSGDIQINYQNKTGGPVRIQLTGPKTLWLTLPTGKTKADLPAGTYSYSYEACEKTVTGTFVVKKKGNTLKLPKCKSSQSSGKTKKVIVDNGTRGTLTLYLRGAQNYTFYFSNGKTTIEVAPDRYEFTAYGCGSLISGTKNLKGGGKTTWSFWCG